MLVMLPKSDVNMDCAEQCIEVGLYEDAKEILKYMIAKSPQNPIPYIKLFELNAALKDKLSFRSLVGTFVKTFGIEHQAWTVVKVLWPMLDNNDELSHIDRESIAAVIERELAQENHAKSPATKTTDEPRVLKNPVRINLLRNIRSSGKAVKPVIVGQISLVSEPAFNQICRAKLEDRVLGRMRELHSIVEKKQLRRVMPEVIEKVEALCREQPNLSEVTDIVISHLHAQCLLGKPAKLPPLLLVGGPGTGKTRFMNKLTEALGLPFCDISLAGSSDTFKISGLSKYWGSADAGLIATTIADAKVGNPVFLFDEIDKAGHSDHGNPLDALLLLLEEESSKRFKDDFIGLPMNLSLSSVLATANSIENLPEALLSRFIVVQVPELDHDGRIIMARSVYAELLQKQGYDAMFSVTMDDIVARKIADLPRHGRELKRAVETSILSAMSEIDMNMKTEDKIYLSLHHLPEINAKIETHRIGFMQ